MSDHSPTPVPPSDAKVWLNVGGFLVLILIFAVIAGVAYLPNRPAPLDAERAAYRAAERVKVATAAAEANRYGWVNREAGVVRLPIDRAMDLTVAELAAAQAAAPGR